MKKYIFYTLMLFSMAAQSFADDHRKDSLESRTAVTLCKHGTRTPASRISYDNSRGWGSNWFIGVQSGTSVFCGSPLGCGDMFDRMTPTFNGYIGKWFKPTVGFRIAGQGFKLKDCVFESMDYACVHADLLYDVSSHFHEIGTRLPRWDFIPYIGVGMSFTDRQPGGVIADGMTDNINHPFTLAYGVQLQYRITNRLHVSAELGGLTTFSSFDGTGSAAQFGDNLISLSIGLSYSIGKIGWNTAKVSYDYDSDDRYHHCFVNKPNKDIHKGGHNDYSGLNSLRARLKGLYDQSADSSKRDSILTVGIPVYFFFKINTAEFVDDCQKINLDEIAAIVKEKNLSLHITGAADRATGSPELNMDLSKRRARRIAKELKDRGVNLDQMKGYSCGGIDTFEPDKANRFTKVVLTRQ